MTYRATAAVATSILAGLLIFEVGARLAQPSTRRVHYLPDPAVGYRLAPSQQVVVEGDHDEYSNLFIVNRAGAPDAERSLEKPVSTFRIAFIGDSMTAGEQVPQDRRFPAVVERLLNQTSTTRTLKVEALNFGTSGYGTAQELLAFRSRVQAYQPDLVVVGFLPGNDIRNNSYALEIERAGRDPISPFFEARGDRLEPLSVDFYSEARDKYTSSRGPLAGGLRTLDIAGSVFRWLLPGPAQDPTSISQADRELETARQLFEPSRQKDDLDWKAAWKTTAMLLTTFRHEVDETGALFHVAVLAGPCALQSQCRAVLQTGQEGREFDWLLPHRMSKHLLSQGDFRATILVEPLARELKAGSAPICYPVDGHYTETGHRLVGKYLAEDLKGYLPRFSSGVRHRRLD